MVHFKPVASGEVVLTATGTPLVSWLRDSHDDAAAIEMESAGIAHAAHLNRSIPSLTIRGVSDHADALKHDADMAGWQRVAAENAAAFTVALIARFLVSPNTSPSTNRDRCRQGHPWAPSTLAHQELV
jgi:nucleoside phosphorylase